ncbi:hypothetical protein P9Z76_27425 [Bacillus cereus]|nr:hypothetical protein [Bacillus cereus]KLA31036.1 hypothetical protein B4080_6174 [Bacillus cereus]MCU4733897.1 hypothetical protein [Bacillus cereus]MEC2945760.1 hypothetical protein [Bacillus cereus]MEC3178368.1 hypothetical protein [Bacillus cereus]
MKKQFYKHWWFWLVAILVIVIFINIVANNSKIKSVSQDAKANESDEEVSKIIDAGNYRLHNADNETRFIYYDDASFSDNFDGFKFTLNPLAVSNKMKTDNGTDVGSVGTAFVIDNTSKSKFIFDTNKIKVSTSQDNKLRIPVKGNFINQTEFMPGDKITDPTKGVISFFDSSQRNLESIQWVIFSFEISKKDDNNKTLKTKQYHIKFNINNHYNDPNSEKKNTSSTLSSKGNRSNPIPINEVATINDLILNSDGGTFKKFNTKVELSILEVIRGDQAYQILKKENQFNKPAPEGKEWALVKVKGKVVDSETQDYEYFLSDMNVNLVSNDGRVYNRELSAVTPNQLHQKLYKGAEGEGYISQVVDVGDDFKIQFNTHDSKKIFFNSK